MDAHRFGRALGTGTRAAAKAIMEAANAAAAPNPTPASKAGEAGRAIARTVLQGKASTTGVRRSGKGFARAVWAPAARAGGVLWYEVTGVFFGLFALTAGAEVWKRRFDLVSGVAGSGKAWFAVAMLAIFGWYTVSSFYKARQRGRRA